MYPKRVHRIMRYALAVAGQEAAPEQRELGPIHLVKYAYLADLAYATKNGGRTYTGIPWRFHHFGPWAREASCEIPPAMDSPRIQQRPFQGELEDDNLRWSSVGKDPVEDQSLELPGEVRNAVEQAVQEFGNDTAALLHHVYLTPPMLRAAPGEDLDFSGVDSGPGPSSEATERMTSQKPWPHREAVRKRFLELLRNPRRRRLVPVDPPPRYDEVFAEGQVWLDSLAGEPIEPETGELLVSDAIWKSHARSDPGIP